MSYANYFDYQAIRNTISDYCFMLDERDLSKFDNVFTHDVEASYPFPGGEMNGLEAVQKVISGRLGRIQSQHALSTQSITVHPDGKTASAKTYFMGMHFGRASREGQVLTAYGTYADELVCVGGEASITGASGKWLIKKRVVSFFSRVGDEHIMDDK